MDERMRTRETGKVCRGQAGSPVLFALFIHYLPFLLLSLSSQGFYLQRSGSVMSLKRLRMFKLFQGFRWKPVMHVSATFFSPSVFWCALIPEVYYFKQLYSSDLQICPETQTIGTFLFFICRAEDCWQRHRKITNLSWAERSFPNFGGALWHIFKIEQPFAQNSSLFVFFFNHRLHIRNKCSIGLEKSNPVRSKKQLNY